MNCEKCKKRESTYESPGKWCDNCWADWWFEDYTPAQRIDAEPFLFVCRAYIDLGKDTSDAKILHHIMQEVTKGSVNPQKVREAIAQYKEFEEETS